MRRRVSLAAAALWATAAAALALNGLTGGTPGQAATPPPYASPTVTPPPLTATATPTPSGTLVRYAGQLLDLRGGFAFFTTGDGFRLAPEYKVIDAANGGPTTLQPATRTYARASFDSGSGAIVELALSKRPLPAEAAYEDIQKFAVAVSTPFPNPDLQPREGYSGKPALVVFTVEVPARTPFADTVYLATDASGWSATAIKMDRIDALHYRIARDFASGTKLLYRYTRGSWQSAERGQNGLEVTPRQLIVPNADVKRQDDVVYQWGDANPNSPDLSGGIPTPYLPVAPSPPHH